MYEIDKILKNLLNFLEDVYNNFGMGDVVEKNFCCKIYRYKLSVFFE